MSVLSVSGCTSLSVGRLKANNLSSSKLLARSPLSSRLGTVNRRIMLFSFAVENCIELHSIVFALFSNTNENILSCFSKPVNSVADYL